MKDAVARMADVRLIQWASHVEDAFEQVSRGLLAGLDEQEAQQLTTQILAKGPAHVKLDATRKRLVAEMEESLGAMSRAEVLQALLDTERAAHDFYRSVLDDLRDPELSELIVALMREEAQHVAVIEQARKASP